MNWLILLGVAWVSLRAEARWLPKSESGSVIETFTVDINVKSSGASESTFEYGLRIQAEDAKASSGKLSIEYNSATDAVEILDAHTLNGRKRIKVEPDAIEDRDAGESKDYDAVKVRSIVFPQVQIGSRLFVRYRIVNAKSVVKDRWSEHFALYPTAATERLSYRVRSDRPLHLEVSDPGRNLTVRQPDPRRIEVTLKRELPGGVQAEKDPYWHPARASEFWISTEREWPVYFANLNKDFQAVLDAELPKPFAKWVEAAAKLKTPEDQAFYLMQQMSENLRYFGDWRRHDGGLVPRSLREIESSRYGDCKDLASALAAMLRKIGFKAHPALIRRGDNPYGREPDYYLPAIARFNHVITRVDRPDGAAWWLDPTNPVASLDPAYDISGRPSLVLEPKAPRLDRTPTATPADYAQEANYVYTFLPGGDVRVRVDSAFRGLGAWRLSNSLLLSPRAQVLGDVLEYFSESEEVTRHKFIAEPKTTRRLADVKSILEFDADRVTYSAGPALFFVMPDSFLNGTFYETANRESDLKLNDMPYASKTSRRLVKTRLVQTPPPACVIDSPFFHVERKVAAEGADVVITQAVELRKAYLTTSDLRSNEFINAQRAARACFSRAGVLIAPGG